MECAVQTTTAWKGAHWVSTPVETDCMFLIVEGACAVLQDGMLHGYRNVGHNSKGIADFFYLLVVTSFESKSSNLFWHWLIQVCV